MSNKIVNVVGSMIVGHALVMCFSNPIFIVTLLLSLIVVFSNIMEWGEY